MDKKNFEKDINVPSKRLDRIDKMEIDLANYELMERDIEKIIEPYQLDWKLDYLSLPSVIQSILERKEQECNKLYIQLKADEEYHKEEENTLRKIIKNKEERNIELYKENNKLKQTLIEIKEILLINKRELEDCLHNDINGQIMKIISECEV